MGGVTAALFCEVDMLINTLIKQQINKIEQSSNKDCTLKEITSDACGSVAKDLAEYMGWIFTNPQEFANSMNAPTRELFMPKEIVEGFNEEYGHDTKVYGYVRRILPDSSFAAKAELVSIGRVAGVSSCKKLVAIKNQVMWHNASKEDVIQHLMRTMK